MSGQKYKRTNFDDDDNTSTGGTPPGVTYDPAIAFKAGANFWQKRSILEKLLLFLTLVLVVVVVILGALLGASGGGHEHRVDGGHTQQGKGPSPVIIQKPGASGPGYNESITFHDHTFKSEHKAGHFFSWHVSLALPNDRPFFQSCKCICNIALEELQH